MGGWTPDGETRDVLSGLHNALRSVIYGGSGFTMDEVDVCFEPPTREFIDRLSRPTVSLVPLDFIENLELGRGDFQVRRSDRSVETAVPHRRIDVRYMATALTTEVADEHELIWRVLAALIRTPEVPPEYLPENIRALKLPVVVRTAQEDPDLKMLDVWSNLSVEAHPAFCCVVTLPIDPELVVRSPLVLTRTARYSRLGADRAVDARTQVGGTVKDAEGRPLPGVVVALDGSANGGVVADADGRFVLRDVPSGPVVLRVTGPAGASATAGIEVPDGPYNISLK
jgi:hypothetical protein